MSRLLSSFALGGWMGFLGVAGLAEASHALGRHALFGIALEAPAVAGAPAVLLAALLLGTAAGLAVALVWLQSPQGDRLRRGELVAFAAIGVCAAMVGSAALFGAPFANVFDRLDLAFWALGLSLLALAFDAVVFEPEKEEDEDEMAFRRSLLAIRASSDAARRGCDDQRAGR